MWESRVAAPGGARSFTTAPTGVDQTPGFDLSGAIVGVTTGLQVQSGNG